jgi:diacylglycerol kinase
MEKFLMSFVHAARGIAVTILHGRNIKVQLFAAALVCACGIWLKVNTTEWCLLTTMMALVISAELMNTALEHVTDLASEAIHPLAKKAKDAAAGAVLILAIASVVLACFIFLPKIL